MAQHLRIAKSDVAPRELGDWAETDTAKDITRSLDLINQAKGTAMTMIAGAPGIGKSLTVKRFCDQLCGEGVYIQAARGEGTVWNFAHSLANLWGYSKPTFSCVSEARDRFADYIPAGSILFVDEAQYLNQRNRKNGQVGEAFEWLRATAETGGFKLVFCGDMSLVPVIESMPQLQSRMLRPVIVAKVSRGDVAAMVVNTAFHNEAAIDALHAVARMKGGLRNVENVTRIAQLFAGGGDPGLDHLKAAIVDMKLSPRGMK